MMLTGMKGLAGREKSASERRRRRAAHLLGPGGRALDRLETRMMPAVVFAPQFGAEHVTQNDGAHLGDNPVYLIFRGSHWNAANEAPDIQATKDLVSPSNHYFDILKQYGSNGHLSYGGAFTNGTDTGAARDREIRGTIENVEGQVPPTGQGPAIFVVVTWNVGDSEHADYAGFNTKYDSNDVAAIWDGSGATFNNGSRSSDSPYAFSVILSHELGEIESDFGGGGIRVTAGAAWPNGASDGQVGDFEGESYSYALPGGTFVQPLWSNADQAWLVTNGSTQQGIVLTPEIVNGAFDGKYALAIHGDNYNFQGHKYGAVANDQVSIAYTNGYVVVTLNGEQAQFPAGQITKIDVDLGQGQNTLSVPSLPGGLTVNDITTTSPNFGTDAVTLGAPGGSLYNFGGTVNLNRASPPGSLTINDTTDYSGGTYQVFSNAIYVHSRAVVTTANAGPITINGVNGGSTFQVNATPAGQKLTLNAGTGFNTVYIASNSEPVAVANATTTGTDSVFLGSGGSLASLASPVSVSNNSGHDYITVNDSANAGADTFALSNNSIQFGGRTLVTNSETAYPAIESVVGGRGGNLFDLNSTSGGLVTLTTGSGTTNVVKVHAAGGPVTVDARLGVNKVTVGADGSLASIAGPVTILGSNASTDVAIDDSNDPTARTFVVNGNGVSGAGLPTINLQGSLGKLSITDAYAFGNRFQVDALPNVSAATLYTTIFDQVYGAAASKVNVVTRHLLHFH